MPNLPLSKSQILEVQLTQKDFRQPRGSWEEIVARRREVALLAAALALAGLVALPRLRFDFDPLHLKNAHTESMATLLELMTNPNATPYTIEILAPSDAKAKELVPRLEALPEVDRVLTLHSFVPEGQPEKLAMIADATFLLLPTLSPATGEPAWRPARTVGADHPAI